MTDISKKAIASAWEEFEICARPNGSVGDLDLYDTEGMQDHAYTLHQISTAQAARIAELEAALETAREDALREAYIRAHNAFQRTENFYMVLGAINPKDTQ